MSFIFNGTTIDTVYMNGVEMDSVYFNSIEVFASAPPPQALSPSIIDTAHFATEFHWKAYNNDSVAGTIWHEAEDSTPDANQDAVAGGGTTPDREYFSSAPKIIVYAQTKNVSGKTDSNIISLLFG